MVVDAASPSQNDGFKSPTGGHLFTPIEFMDRMQPTQLITEYDRKA